MPRLRAIAPTTAIRGNVDTQEWAREFPDQEALTLAGRSIYVLHDLGDLDPVTAGFDIVISGHSHRPRVETTDGVLYLNPGSAGPRRFRLPITLATLVLSGDTIRPELHQLG
jgi:putative phosphoesterase